MAFSTNQQPQYSKIISDLKGGNLRPVYFAMGSDFYLYRKFITQLGLTFKAKFGENAGFEQRWGADLKVASDVSVLLGGGGLFSSASLIMLHEIQDSGNQVKTKLADLLKSLPSDTVVVAHYSVGDFRRAKWLDAMKSVGQVVSLQSPEGSALENMVREISDEHDLAIDDSGIRRLIELSSGELAIIKNELEKLALYLDESSHKIDRDLVDKVSGAVENAHVDQLVQAFSKRDRQVAIDTLIQIHHQGKEGLPYLVAMLYNRLIQLMALQENPEARKSISQGSTSYYFLKDLSGFTRSYSLAELQVATRTLAKLDIDFRMGSTDMLSAFTTWISNTI